MSRKQEQQKALTRDEANIYQRTIIRSALYGGFSGLCSSTAATVALNRCWPPFRSLSPSIKSTFILYPTFLLVAAGANHGDQMFQSRVHPDRNYVDTARRHIEELEKEEDTAQRLKELAYEHRYWLLGSTWLTTVAASLWHTKHDVLLSGVQKFGQARIAAQTSTITIFLLTAAMEIRDAREGRGKYEAISVTD